MFDARVSCRRIMAADRGAHAGRLPICAPISWYPEKLEKLTGR